MNDVNLPYFDALISQLEKGNAAVAKSFGRHVHWGYWPNPEAATGTDDDYGRAAEQMTLELTALAGITDGMKILDVGCGFGGTMATLNENHRDLDLTGLNIDPRQIARAREIVQPLNGNTIEFVVGDACALPFPDASFDRVTAVECIFHFPSRAKFFAEARRVLKPGGVLTLSDFVPSTLFAPICKFGTVTGLYGLGIFGASRVDQTIANYRDLARGAGFAVVAERDITAHTLPTYAYVQKTIVGAGQGGLRDAAISQTMALVRWISRKGLVNYYILSFRKT